MKKLFVLCFLSATLVGCKSGYDLTLTNGNKFSGISKPVLDKSGQLYRFKADNGQQMTVPAGRVRLIEPHSDSPISQFNSSGVKK
ncbi:MAG: hypothetical protein ABJC04_09850 [Verrucomicrobiota bacterium]